MTSEPYIFLGLREDGSIPAIDVAHEDDPVNVLQRALAFLREHASCNTVEVWRDGCLVSVFKNEAGPTRLA